jgi:hypothetical protein
VTTAGAFELYAVNGAWTESGLTFDLPPALGSVIDSNVPITAADKNQYILIPMTATVQEWLTTPSSNFGVALVAGAHSTPPSIARRARRPVTLRN